jgi:hypothetical protein
MFYFTARVKQIGAAREILPLTLLAEDEHPGRMLVLPREESELALRVVGHF